MRTHEVTGRATGHVDPDAESGGWSLVDDPAAWRRFVADVIDRHHRVVSPGSVTDQCSCGRPFMLCSIAPLAAALVEQGQELIDRGGGGHGA